MRIKEWILFVFLAAYTVWLIKEYSTSSETLDSAVATQSASSRFAIEVGEALVSICSRTKLLDQQSIETLFSRATANRDANALVSLAKEASTHSLLPSRAFLAESALRQAADLGSSDAMVTLGAYEERKNAASRKSAGDWYSRAAALSNKEAIVKLYSLRNLHNLQLPGYSEVAFEDVLRSGSPSAKIAKASSYIRGGKFESAAELLESAYQTHDNAALFVLAKLYSDHHIDPRDPAIKRLVHILVPVLDDSKPADEILNETADPKEIATALVAMAEDGVGPAWTTIARLMLVCPNLKPSDLMYARLASMNGLDHGVNGSAFFLAVTVAVGGDLDVAKNILAIGNRNGDWRSSYAIRLCRETGLRVLAAFSLILSQNYVDYQNFAMRQQHRVAGTSPKALTPLRISLPHDMEMRLQGTSLEIFFTVDKNGIPVNIDVRNSPDASVTAEIVRKVSGWRFKPATRAGVVVPQVIIFPIRFNAVESHAQT